MCRFFRQNGVDGATPVIDDPIHDAGFAMSLTAQEPRRNHFSSLSPHGFHRVVYFEWGDPAQSRRVQWPLFARVGRVAH